MRHLESLKQIEANPGEDEDEDGEDGEDGRGDGKAGNDGSDQEGARRKPLKRPSVTNSKGGARTLPVELMTPLERRVLILTLNFGDSHYYWFAGRCEAANTITQEPAHDAKEPEWTLATQTHAPNLSAIQAKE
jgi:hypothetical protein